MTTFPPPSPPYLGPPDKFTTGENKPIDRIVLHGTVSPCVPGGARVIASYFRGQTATGSAQYVVDPREAVQTAYDSVICWHAPPNPRSLGVEFCDPVGDKAGRALPMSRWDDKPHTAMLEVSAPLVAQLCLAYRVPIRFRSPRQLKAGGAGARGICEHSDVSAAFHESTHWDLGNFPRHRFLRMVAHEAAVLTQAADPVKPKPKPLKVTRIDKARDLLELTLRHTAGKVRRRRIKAGLDALPKH